MLRGNGVPELCACTMANSHGLYPYKEILELFCGARVAGELYSASVEALRRGTWRPGPGGRGQAPAFTQPRETRGAATSTMASIGERMIALKTNYEEELLLAAGADSETARPTVSGRRLR